VIILLFAYHVNRFCGFYFSRAEMDSQERSCKEPGEQYDISKKTHPDLAGGPDINLIRIGRPYGLLSPEYPGDNR